jgi:hypothetical protein
MIGLALVFGLIGFAAVTQSDAHRGYGMHHGNWRGDTSYDRGGGWSYCPYCGARFDDRGRGGHHMDSWMMGPGYGRRGMGPGMMNPRYDRRYDYPDDPRYRPNQKPLEKDEAKEQVEDMLKRSRNPNLKLGDIEDKENYYVVDILTKDGSLVDKMQVHKKTGMMRSVY